MGGYEKQLVDKVHWCYQRFSGGQSRVPEGWENGRGLSKDVYYIANCSRLCLEVGHGIVAEDCMVEDLGRGLLKEVEWYIVEDMGECQRVV